jgi:nicotinamide-nucleotide amidase
MTDPEAPRIEIVTIGSELLRGDTIDTNGAWLGRALLDMGIAVARRVTVADDNDAIRDAVEAALHRTGAVLCTGGLGPTTDDLTRDVVADLFDMPLQRNEPVLDAIRRRFDDMGVVMPEINVRQAMVPAGARVLDNRNGTAPGLLLEDDRGLAILLPGVPGELYPLFNESVAPLLRERWAGRLPPIRRALLRTTGAGESRVMEEVADLIEAVRPVDIAFLPHTTGVDVRLSVRGDAGEDDVLEAAARRFQDRLHRWVYTTEELDLAECVGASLRRQRRFLVLAESCTGGLIAKRVTDIPGSSAWFATGWVTYANDAKIRDLGVGAADLERFGAVSEIVARQMASGARRRSGAACAIAVTGIAGPGGASADKPLGTVWIATDVNGDVTARSYRFSGSREQVRERAAQAALRLLQQRLDAPAGSRSWND